MSLAVIVLPLSACSSTSSSSRVADPAVSRQDVVVGVHRSMAVCGIHGGTHGGPSPVIPPGLPTDAPATGDLVPAGAVAVAVCPSYTIESNGRHPSIDITGRSLATLITAMNAEAPYDANGPCTSDQSWTRFLVFLYADGRQVPIRLDASGCGLADNGAQQRFGGWEKQWEERLYRVSGGRD